MRKKVEAEAPCINIIGQKTEIKGDINISGDVRIDGTLTGNFFSNQKLVVGPSGVIEGNITCKDCDISGKVVGNLYISDVLALKSTSDVRGDIVTNKIMMELDAQFSGICKTGQNVPEIKNIPEDNK